MPVDYGFYAQGLWVPIERKEVPGDFMASWYDGRLTEQTMYMAENRLGFLILEGQFPVRKDMRLQLGPRVTDITFGQIVAKLASLCLYGVYAIPSTSIHTTPVVIKALYDLFQKSDHASVLQRPPLKVPSSWRVPTRKLRGLHFIQGIHRVGPKLAAKLWKRAYTLRYISVLTREEVQEALGPVTGGNVYDFLDLEWEEEPEEVEE